MRERRTDVPMLAEHFLKRFARETGRKIRGFTTAAMHKMEQYDWPGNVRELKNVIERAVALARGPQLDVADILLSSLELPGGATTASGDTFEPISLEELRNATSRTLNTPPGTRARPPPFCKSNARRWTARSKSNQLRRTSNVGL